MKRTVCTLAVIVVIAAFLAGCGKTSDKPAVAKPMGEAAAVDISTLPEFLRYPGATATERIALSTSDSKGTVWTLVTKDQKTTVESWYGTSVEKAGWVKVPETKVGILSWEKPDKSETIKMLVYEQDGKTHISITHGLKPDD
ncbi:MAG: hypothetical protein ABIL25_05455 [candidate division WOR-3 bacterium]